MTLAGTVVPGPLVEPRVVGVADHGGEAPQVGQLLVCLVVEEVWV